MSFIGVDAFALIMSIIAAFGGGVFGAVVGALPAFIITGFISIAAALDPTGIGAGVAFGPFFGPGVSFLSGVAAAAYAKKIGLMDNGADIATALAKFNNPTVLAVGGVFGIVGYLITCVAATIGAAAGLAMDTNGFAVFWGAVIARLALGKRGLLSAPEVRKPLSTGNALSTTLLIAVAYSLAVSGGYVAAADAIIESGVAYHVLIFGIAAAGLVFAEFGQAYVGWHHIGIISAEAVVAGYAAFGAVGGLVIGVIAGVVAAILADFDGNFLNTDVDAHIDPPAFAIWIMTIIVGFIH